MLTHCCRFYFKHVILFRTWDMFCFAIFKKICAIQGKENTKQSIYTLQGLHHQEYVYPPHHTHRYLTTTIKKTGRTHYINHPMMVHPHLIYVQTTFIIYEQLIIFEDNPHYIKYICSYMFLKISSITIKLICEVIYYIT